MNEINWELSCFWCIWFANWFLITRHSSIHNEIIIFFFLNHFLWLEILNIKQCKINKNILIFIFSLRSSRFSWACWCSWSNIVIVCQPIRTIFHGYTIFTFHFNEVHSFFTQWEMVCNWFICCLWNQSNRSPTFSAFL